MRVPTLSLIVVGLCLALTTVVRAGDSFSAVLDPYFRIQGALVDDRIDTLKADAAEVAEKARELGNGGQAIVSAAAELQAAGDLERARAAFGKLSDAVIAYADQTKTSPGTGVSTMYCPMVKKSWLQKGDEVRNPYYGKAMLDCGVKKKVG